MPTGRGDRNQKEHEGRGGRERDGTEAKARRIARGK